MNRFRLSSSLIASILVLAGIFPAINEVNAGSSDPSHTTVFLPLIQSVTSSGTTQQAAFPTLDQFIGSVENGEPGIVTGIYVDGVFALPVIQQPDGNYNYISTTPDVITQYRLASQMGVIGLLAHNNLAGKHFYQLTEGQTIAVIFGDGVTISGQVVILDQYQALEPANAYSLLQNLSTGEVLDSNQAFLKYYTEEGTITFQTCISKGNSSSWGRMFIVARILQ